MGDDKMTNALGVGASAASGTGQTDPASRTSVGDLQAYIGRQLRAVYDDVARQPVPDRFIDLIKKLDAVER